MGPIERAAMVLATNGLSFNPGETAETYWLNKDRVLRSRYMDDVRAVIAAIREPSTEMLGDVHDTLLYHIRGNEMDTARIVWDRFIEVLLEDGR